MDTQKKDSYRKIICILMLILAIGLNAYAEEKQPAQVLIDSCQLPEKITKETAEKTISELNEALALCTDNTLKFRIEYRVGMIYFKSDDFSKAIDCFEKINQASDCPDLIKLCSFNMAGQIYKMQAKDDKALGAFENLIELSQKFLTHDPNQENPASVLKLVIASGFAKAEIHQYNQEYDPAINEYKRIITCINSHKIADINNYASLALDRLSQLYLVKARIEDYNQTAVELTKDYPNYYRTAIVKLELESVKLLKQKDASAVFPRGGFDAPARLIGLIKDGNDKELMDNTSLLLRNLYNQYHQSYSGILLGYHYAWLLDTMGEQKEAVKILEAIYQDADKVNTDGSNIRQITNVLIDYAKFQQAVIFGEENKYREALEIIYSLKSYPNDTHMRNLSDSIENALQTLKREVPKDANVQ